MDIDRDKLIRWLLIGAAVVLVLVLAYQCAPTPPEGPGAGEDGGGGGGTQIEVPEQTEETESQMEPADKSPEQYFSTTEMAKWASVASQFRIAVGAPGDISKDEWLATLQPLVTGELLNNNFALIDEVNILRGTPQGQMSGVEYGDNYVILEDRWGTDSSWEARYMVQRLDDGSWKITSYTPRPL